MNTNEKARPATAITERAEAAAPGGAAAPFDCQYTMQTPLRQVGIAELLRPGSENGTRLSELVQLTGEDERTVRRRIQRERKAGKLILSDNASGYFLPASADDVRRFVRSMSRRAREISAIASVAEDVLAQTEGQEVVKGWR